MRKQGVRQECEDRIGLSNAHRAEERQEDLASGQKEVRRLEPVGARGWECPCGP